MTRTSIRRDVALLGCGALATGLALSGAPASADPALSLPHPRAAERAFVLVPWSQADPFAELAGHSVSELAENAPDRGGLRWLAFDWLESDALPDKPTGPYVEPPVEQAAGDAKKIAEAEAALTARRAWLEQVLRSAKA